MKNAQSPTELSERVKRLVIDLGSVVMIEAVLALARTPQRSFSAAELARQLGIGTDLEPILERLGSLNLLDIRVRSKVSYRFAPSSPEREEAVRELAIEYAERRPAVLEQLAPDAPVSSVIGR